MNSALALLFPLALFTAPAPGIGPAPPALVPGEEREMQASRPGDIAEVWEDLSEAYRIEPQEQVRIERRVIVRISPRMPLQNEGAAASSAAAAARRFDERRIGKCVPIKGISGVQISQQDRLLLFMRDQTIVSVRLQKSCSARDFYSGFYVENSSDGMICAGRDTLHSRAGVNCDVARLYRLVPED